MCVGEKCVYVGNVRDTRMVVVMFVVIMIITTTDIISIITINREWLMIDTRPVIHFWNVRNKME